ncbi:MAG: hypothetical protein O9350_17935 [Microcystis sp. LE19-388.1G]|nr:hypothetical protein [Microcystis sp. LE19-388.1G]
MLQPNLRSTFILYLIPPTYLIHNSLTSPRNAHEVVTPHPTPYTLHPTPHTPHPTPPSAIAR